MARSPLLFITLMLLSTTVSARDLIPGDNRIDRVTIFLDRAEVTRQLTVTVPNGKHTLLAEQLPAQLFEASLRASGRGPAGLRIATVESRRVYGEQVAAEQERKLRQQLQSLKDQQAQLEGRREALDTQAKFIEQLATTPQEPGDKGSRLLPPQQWPAAWQAIGKGMAETNSARVALKQEQRELKDRIRKVEQELQQIQTGRRDTITAAIQIEADKPGKATFELHYQLAGASWSPLYDAALQSENGTIILTQAATIQQNTGEDWNGAALSVSTARPSAGAAMPELPPWWINFPPRPLAKRKSGISAESMDMLADEAMAPSPTKQQNARDVEARTVRSEFSVRYAIPGRVTVPADNSKHRFVLNKQQLLASLSARTTPKIDNRAFLYAELDYQGEAPLLPGPWRLQRDGTFVGTQHNQALRPGQHIALAFGADDAIEVDYKLLRDKRGEQGLISRQQNIQRRYRITITNHHQRKLPVSVFDQIPVSQNEEIQVVLADNSTPPTRRNIEDRQGVLEWQSTMEPNGKWSLDFGYDVSYPKGRQLPGF